MGPISFKNVPPADRCPLFPSVRSKIFPIASTTALDGVAAACALSLVEKVSKRRNKVPLGSLVNRV